MRHILNSQQSYGNTGIGCQHICRQVVVTSSTVTYQILDILLLYFRIKANPEYKRNIQQNVGATIPKCNHKPKYDVIYTRNEQKVIRINRCIGMCQGTGSPDL